MVGDKSKTVQKKDIKLDRWSLSILAFVYTAWCRAEHRETKSNQIQHLGFLINFAINRLIFYENVWEVISYFAQN